MKIPKLIVKILRSAAGRVIIARNPDFSIGDDVRGVYLHRWWIIPKNRFLNIYLHYFLRSDDDRALHTHPWINCSLLLDGNYIEHTTIGADHRTPGYLYFRLPLTAHRIQLWHDDSGKEIPVMTLFLTGPHVKEWGFLCPKGFVHWREYTSGNSQYSHIGKGCD